MELVWVCNVRERVDEFADFFRAIKMFAACLYVYISGSYTVNAGFFFIFNNFCHRSFLFGADIFFSPLERRAMHRGSINWKSNLD